MVFYNNGSKFVCICISVAFWKYTKGILVRRMDAIETEGVHAYIA